MSDDLKTWNAALADAGDVLRGQLKDANDRIKELEAAHCKAMERAMADVVRVDADNAKLRDAHESEKRQSASMDSERSRLHAECENLKTERDEIKAGRASFFDVHAKMQDRLSDAEDDNAQLREAMNNIQIELCKIGPWSFHEDVSKHVEASEQYAQIALQEGGGV